MSRYDIAESTRPKAQQRRRDHPRGGHDVEQVHHSGSGSHYRKRSKADHIASQGNGRKHHQRPLASKNNPPSTSQEHHGEVMMEDEFEVGSVFNAGSKKQNLNHLLNFQFEPRGTTKKSHGQRGQGRIRKFSDSKSRPKYNKEQYLQAK